MDSAAGLCGESGDSYTVAVLQLQKISMIANEACEADILHVIYYYCHVYL